MRHARDERMYAVTPKHYQMDCNISNNYYYSVIYNIVLYLLHNIFFVRKIKREGAGIERGRMPSQQGRMAHQQECPTWASQQQKHT